MMLKQRCSSSGAAQRRCTHKAFSSAGRCLSRVRPTVCSRRQQAVYALGFDFGDSTPAAAPSRAPSPKAFAAFTLKASSLLVYQGVMKGAVGEALLALMAQSQKFQSSNKDIIASYTKFYQLLMLSGYDCWRDYVLDQILLGRDNPFARAAAQGQVEKNAPILQAVAYDLDTLQGLSVSLTVLSEFIGEVAPTAGSYWVSAASAVAVKRSSSIKQLSGDSPPVKPAVVIPDSSSSSSSSPGSSRPSAATAGSSGGSNGGAGFIGPPPTPEGLAEWCAAIAGHSSWSDALPLLQQYYLQHGYGVTSRNAALRWSKGGFDEASEGGLLAGRTNSSSSNPVTTLSLPAAAAGTTQQQTVLPVLQGAYAQLAANTRAHCAGGVGCHAVVCGPPGAGKSWLLWEGTLMAGREAGVRVVEVPSSEVANLVDIARGCGRYPRVHFILVVDHLELPYRGAAAPDLLGALAAAGGSGWPSNTLLYVGVSATSTVTRSDPLVSRCPLVVSLNGVDTPEQYWETVQSLLPPQSSSSSEGGSLDKLKEAALQWGQQQGMSVRSAAAFARSCRL